MGTRERLPNGHVPAGCNQDGVSHPLDDEARSGRERFGGDSGLQKDRRLLDTGGLSFRAFQFGPHLFFGLQGAICQLPGNLLGIDAHGHGPTERFARPMWPGMPAKG